MPTTRAAAAPQMSTGHCAAEAPPQFPMSGACGAEMPMPPQQFNYPQPPAKSPAAKHWPGGPLFQRPPQFVIDNIWKLHPAAYWTPVRQAWTPASEWIVECSAGQVPNNGLPGSWVEYSTWDGRSYYLNQLTKICQFAVPSSEDPTQPHAQDIPCAGSPWFLRPHVNETTNP